MSAYKDKKTGKWFVFFYYRDWQGKNKGKTKRGFQTKREALAPKSVAISSAFINKFLFILTNHLLLFAYLLKFLYSLYIIFFVNTSVSFTYFGKVRTKGKQKEDFKPKEKH